jgi:hypothetical protein
LTVDEVVFVNEKLTPTLTLKVDTNERTASELRAFSASTTTIYNSKTGSNNIHTPPRRTCLAANSEQYRFDANARQPPLTGKPAMSSGGCACDCSNAARWQAGHPPIVWTHTTNAVDLNRGKLPSLRE